jgi:hypothetical protein
MIATRVYDDRFFADRIADDGAVALQRTDGEGFADQGGACNGHGKSMACIRQKAMNGAQDSTPLADTDRQAKYLTSAKEK